MKKEYAVPKQGMHAYYCAERSTVSPIRIAWYFVLYVGYGNLQPSKSIWIVPGTYDADFA